MSDLDLAIARAVPPGGNWRDIPENIPSKRIQGIRESYKQGGGSRSTYYGRLSPALPSYTINTYFSRPGNGCHLHYDYTGGQHRVISHREAARLQSFPDSFVFEGKRSAIETQIGNAVPALLAYQIAKTLPGPGEYVDLFCGAGGLSLGFKWAGWRPLVANDKEPAFLATYGENIHHSVVPGSLADPEVLVAVVKAAQVARSRSGPLFVIGGPPCQGFSTAGNRRSMEDERNWLFEPYRAVIERLRPDGFVFENVTGLLNMEGGAVLAHIKAELGKVSETLTQWVLQAERYAVPQRRTRLFLIGSVSSSFHAAAPREVCNTTGGDGAATLFSSPLAPVVCVREALSDLPPLAPGEDGSHLEYLSEPLHPFQAFMRGVLSPDEYLDAIRLGVR